MIKRIFLVIAIDISIDEPHLSTMNKILLLRPSNKSL